MRSLGIKVLWFAVAVLGAIAYAVLALRRHEQLNSAYILVAALCSYAIGFRFYSKWIATRVLVLVVVKALAESPLGVFTVGATIPIAMLLGGYLRFWRIGKVSEASAFGIVLLLLAVWGGQFVHGHPLLSQVFTLRDINLAWAI